jgi:hypothetical protein
LAAAVLVPGFRAVVKADGLRRGASAATRLAAAPRLRSTRRRGADADAMAATVDAVTRRLPVQSKCLPRSLTLWTMLQRAGFDAVLRIGMRTDGSDEAHAWVEYNGRPVGEEVDPETLVAFPLDHQLPAPLVGSREMARAVQASR